MVRKVFCKRILSLLAVISIAFSAFVYRSADAAKETQDNFDVEAFMNNIGIGTVNDKNAFITRGDFVVLLLQALGHEELSGDEYFLDTEGVQGEYINTAAQMGIVSKNEEKLFFPDRIISAAEASAMTLRVLGYTEIMDDTTFPSAYMSWASKLRILDGVYGREQLSGADATRILYNMLNTKYVRVELNATKEKSVYTTSDGTYMEDVLGVYKRSGIVQSVCGLSLNNAKAASDTEIVIGGIKYMNPFYGETKNYLYLGRNVNYYVRESKDGDEVIYMYSNEELLSVFSLDVESVKGFDSNDAASYKKNPVLSYRKENNRTEKILIDPKADIFVNGTASISVSNDDFIPESGMIYLSDRNGDGVYDVVSIEKYTYYYVEEYESSNGIIVDHYEKESIKLLDIKEKNLEFVYDETLADSNIVTKGAVLEVMCSYTDEGKIDYSKFIRIGLSKGKVSGRIESFGEDVIYIDGNEYRYLKSLESKIKEEASREGTWLIGRDNLIVACDDFDGKVALNYGWLVDVQSYGKLTKSFNFKVFTTRGEMLVFDAAENLKYTGPYNGEYVYGRRLKTDEVLRVITPRELIKYDLDENGNICLVQKAVDNTVDADYVGYDDDYFSLDYKTGACYSATGWIESGHTLDSANTICLYVSTTSTDEKDFAASDYDARGSSVSGYPLKVYDSDKALCGGVAVFENVPVKDAIAGSKYFTISKVWMVTKKTYISQPDGTDKVRLDVARGQNVRSYYATDDELEPLNDIYYHVPTNVKKFSDLKPGDIISVDINKLDMVEGFVVLNDFDSTFENSYSEGYQLNSGKDFLADFKRVLGKTTYFRTGSVLKLDSAGTDRFSVGRQSTNYMVYNANSKTFENPTGPEDISEGDYVWAYVYRTNVHMLVKYTNE